MSKTGNKLAVWSPRPVAEVITALRPADLAGREATELSTQMPAIEARFGDSKEDARANLAHLSGLMRASEQTATKLATRGFFKKLWGKLTGEEPRSEAEVRTNLAKVQARAVAVTERLLERQTYLQESTRFLGARTELMAVENLKLKAALVGLGQRVFDRMDHLEDRMARLERRGDSIERRVALNELFQSGFSASIGLPYDEIGDPLVRVLALAKDFADASGGDWRPMDFHRLQKLAKGDAAIDDAQQFSVSELVGKALDSLGDSGQLADWVGAGELRGRLMAPMDDETESARAFYPLHFLLQRPAWFVAQGLPKGAGVPVIVAELEAHGLATDESLGLWQVLRLLLEERSAWQMESGDLPTALPLPQADTPPAQAVATEVGGTTLQVFPTTGMVVRGLFMVGEQTVAVGMTRSSNRLTLYHLTESGPERIQGQPRLPNEAVNPASWAYDGTVLWTISEDRRGADGVRWLGRGAQPWGWSCATFPTAGRLHGLAARPGELAGWESGQIYRWGSKAARARRTVLDACGGPNGFYLLQKDHIQLWSEGGDPEEWALLPKGWSGAAMAMRASGLPLVHIRGRDGDVKLLAIDHKPSVIKVTTGVEFLAMGDGAVVLEDDGRLLSWSPGSATRPIELDGVPRFERIVSGEGRKVAGFDRRGERVIVFGVK